MEEKYTHALNEQTASSLVDFAKGLKKLFELSPNEDCRLFISYDDAPVGTEHTEALAHAERDDEGDYFFNGDRIGNLDQAVRVYALMCSGVIKAVAADERREDYFEDLDRNPLPNEEDEAIRSLLSQVDLELDLDDSDAYSETDDSDEEGEEIIEDYKMSK